ncbi:unnamed protein product [Cylicostephanus goldi]|uniref:Uncharacterized protein n=1 Tax=Cylicostephanus goldi TaxID=71465 RepID=A0A3P7MUY8_CYLGO|nr:unnamed protein product [Cylicostephanus goldi]
MTGRTGYMFLLALFTLSMVEVFVKGTVPAHSEDEHDADEFRKEFGDEPQQNSYSQGSEDDHVEVRDGSQFSNVKPKILTGRKLPTLRFLYWTLPLLVDALLQPHGKGQDLLDFFSYFDWIWRKKIGRFTGEIAKHMFLNQR